MRLNPHYSFTYSFRLGQAYQFMGQSQKAISEYRKVLIHSPDYVLAHIHLAIVYSQLGREIEAQAEVAEILRISPKFSLEVLSEMAPFDDQAVIDQMIEALRKAGLR